MRVKNYRGANAKPLNNQSNRQEFVVAEMPDPEGQEKWKIGGCPRCHGDIFLDSEDGDILGHCLQCGFVGIGGSQKTAKH